MADILEATESNLVRRVDGTDRTFRFLNAYDRAELLRDDLKRRRDALAERKEKVIANLKLAGISGEQMYAELESFDDRSPDTATEADWIDLVNSPLNEVAIYTRSLSQYGTEAESIAKLTNLPLSDKAKICGLSVVTKADVPDPNPQAPGATYTAIPAQTSSTGESASPSSDTGSISPTP